MSENPTRILLVEDNAPDAQLLSHILRQVRRFRYELTHVQRLSDALDRLQAEPFDVLLLDLHLPDSQGHETISEVLRHAPRIPIIVLTGMNSQSAGLEALRCGAQDFLVKGEIDGWSLVRSIRYALERKHGEEEILRLIAEHQSAAEGATAARKAAADSSRMFGDLVRSRHREQVRVARTVERELLPPLSQARAMLDELAGSTLLGEVAACPGGQDLPRRLAQALDLVDRSLAACRSVQDDLPPAVIQDGGLVAALEWLAERMKARHGLSVTVEAEAAPAEIADRVAIPLYYASRELLENVARHARVDSARVEVRRTQGEQVQIAVRDEGAGFDPARAAAKNDAGTESGPGTENAPAAEDGAGALSGLGRVRGLAGLVGGEVTIDAAPGRGTCVRLTCPLCSTTAWSAPAAEPAVPLAMPPAISPPGPDREADEPPLQAAAG